MEFVKEAEDLLKSRGFRLTEPRKKVIRILSKAKGPLSPYEIQRLLRKENVALNHVTIYRALELLCSLNLAHRVITASGFMRCTLEDRHGCHRYMICRSCGSVAEFSDGDLCKRENEIASQMGFYAEQHIAESMGLCSKCSRKKRGSLK